MKIYLLSPDNDDRTIFLDSYARNKGEVEELVNKFLFFTWGGHIDTKEFYIDLDQLIVRFKSKKKYEVWDEDNPDQFYEYRLKVLEPISEDI